MSSVCRICLDELGESEFYHPRCLKELFGIAKAPRFDVELSKLHTAALAMVGRTSLSGVQRKVSVNLSADRQTLQVAAGGGRFILKPQTEIYPSLPENEHLCTRLAKHLRIDVAPCGLVSLQDGSLAYIARRFDRLADGSKVHQEDFCQLAEKSPKDKYDASAELCVRLIRTFASEPLIEILKFYRLLVFSWWMGNGDMHLKNFSLMTDPQGRIRLTPAYDLVCTQLVITDDPLALPVCGKKENLTRKLWLQFAEYCELPTKTAVRVLDQLIAATDESVSIVQRSFLPDEMRSALTTLLRRRSNAIV